MSIWDNIQAIEHRIAAIQARFEMPPCHLPSSPEVRQTASFSEILRCLEEGTGENKTSDKSDYESTIKEAGNKFGIDPDLISAVITQESGFNPFATSHAGAKGLMQLMPDTALSLGVNNVFDPRENIFGGVAYLRQLLDRFKGNLSLALAAYNAGPGAVEKYGGIPPYQETQNYVKSILSLYNRNRQQT